MECGIVTVDLHGRNTYQAKVTVDALLRRAGAGKRLLRSPDGGATDLVLREMTE